MAETTTLCARGARLRDLLHRTSGLDDEAVAVARSMDERRAAEIVASAIEAELSHPKADGTAIRAAHLAHALRLADAIPVLARCVERLGDRHPLGTAAISALSRLGPSGTEALLSAFDRCRTSEVRAALAQALAWTPGEDARVRAALVRLLDEDPALAARLLAMRGEWAAVPELSKAVTRIAGDPDDDCPACTSEQLRALAVAIRALGGALSDEQWRGYDDVLARRDASFALAEHALEDALEDAMEAVARGAGPAARPARPGRNDPCPCGSGKKYKKCHLGSIGRARH